MTGHAHDWWDGLWRCRCGAGPFPDFGGFAEHATGAYCDPGRLNESTTRSASRSAPKALTRRAGRGVARAGGLRQVWHTSRPGYSYTLHWYVLSHEERHNRLYRLIYRAVWEHGEFSVFAWQPTRVLTLDAWRYWAYWYTPEGQGVLNRVNIVRGTLTRKGLAPVDGTHRPPAQASGGLGRHVPVPASGVHSGAARPPSSCGGWSAPWWSGFRCASACRRLWLPISRGGWPGASHYPLFKLHDRNLGNGVV